MSFFSSTDSNRESNSWFLSGILSRSICPSRWFLSGILSGAKDLSSSKEGGGTATEGVALSREGVTLGREAVLELVINKLGSDVDVEEEVETVIVVLVTTFGAARGKEVVAVVVVVKEVVVVIEVERVAAVDVSSFVPVEPREHDLIVVGFEGTFLDSSSIDLVSPILPGSLGLAGRS